MNVTATTLPRRSRSDSRVLSCVVSVNSGAGPIFDRRSLPFASRAAAVIDQFSVASPMTISAQSARRLILPFQLLLQLIEKSPVGALGDDLLRAALDHPDLTESERIEA